MQQRAGIPFGLLNFQNNPLFQTAGKSRFLQSNINQTNQNDLKAVGQKSLENNTKGVAVSDLFKQAKEKPNEFISSLATDKKENVDSNLSGLYDGSGDIGKIMGALNKLTSTDNDSLKQIYEDRLKDKPSAEKSVQEVNKFFGVDPKEETPAWADAALAIGASLLEAPKPGQTPLQQFGTALAAGGVAAKAKKKEKKARDFAIKQLAFSQFKEDKKSNDALAVQYQKFLKEIDKNKKESVKTLLEYTYKNKNLEVKKQNDIGDAITASLNVIPEKLRPEALKIIYNPKNKEFLAGMTNAAQVPSTIYSLLKSKKFDFTLPDDGKNLVARTVKVTDPNTYNAYKLKFPNVFTEDYNPSKTYTISGFVDKTATGAFINNIQQPSVSFSNTTTPSQIGKLEGEISTLQKDIVSGTLSIDEIDDKNAQINIRKAAIKKYAETTGSVLFVNEDGNLTYATGTKDQIVGGLDTQKNKDQIKKYEDTKNHFLRVVALGDIILAKTADPEFSKSIGFFDRFADFAQGVKTQFKAFTDGYDQENYSRYIGDNAIANIIANPNGKTAEENTFIKRTFTNFEKATRGNQAVQTAVMEIAYAIAGTRETGKLTDKDIAMSLDTIGGRGFAEKDFFANPLRLQEGIRQAVKSANINFGLKAQTYYRASQAYEKKQGNDNYELLTYDPLKLIKSNLDSLYPGISDRMLLNTKPGGGLEYVPNEWYLKNVYGKSSNVNDDTSNLKDGFKISGNEFKDISSLSNFVLRASGNRGEFQNKPFVFQTDAGPVSGDQAIELLVRKILTTLDEDQQEQFLKQIGYNKE